MIGGSEIVSNIKRHRVTVCNMQNDNKFLDTLVEVLDSGVFEKISLVTQNSHSASYLNKLLSDINRVERFVPLYDVEPTELSIIYGVNSIDTEDIDYYINGSSRVVLFNDKYSIQKLHLSDLHKKDVYTIDLPDWEYKSGGINSFINDVLNYSTIKYKDIINRKYENVYLTLSFKPSLPGFLEPLISVVDRYMQNGYDLYKDIFILTPSIRGKYGSLFLNDYLRKHFNKNIAKIQYGANLKNFEFVEKDKVISKISDADKGIIAGEEGTVEGVTRSSITVHYYGIDKKVDYLKSEADKKISLAYAMNAGSCHSGRKKLSILFLHSADFVRIDNFLIYTAAIKTHGRLHIISDKSALYLALNKR